MASWDTTPELERTIESYHGQKSPIFLPDEEAFHRERVAKLESAKASSSGESGSAGK